MNYRKLEDIKGEIHPRCATCGTQDNFEYNEDQSYIKCLCCGRVYFGGKGELLSYNEDEIERVKSEMAQQARRILQETLSKAFKKYK